jgi:uncharacterized iron-regulated protein
MRGLPRLRRCVVLVALTVAASEAAAQDRTLQLAIGDPARKDKQATLVLDGITATATGDVLAPRDLAARLASTQLLLIGEAHTSVESHRVQLRVIEALVAAGRRVMVGLEMYPYTAQTSLDQWSQGWLTEPGFVRLSRWYEHWGYSWRYYREIFAFARDHGLPMVGVNTPREVVTAVRKKGFANLTAEEAARIPPDGVDVESADHMAFFKASFDEGDTVHGGASEDVWTAMLSAQATWDASMGWNAVQALQKQNDSNVIMVVLVGSGHVAYDVGIVRQARRWFRGGIATLIPVPTATSGGEAVETVRASYADYVWGVPWETAAAFPTLGVFTRADGEDRRVILQVDADSAASRAGFEAGDVLLSMDGQALVGRETLNVLIAAKQWGDSAVFVVRRGEAERTLTAYFRRAPMSRSAPQESATPKR